MKKATLFLAVALVFSLAMFAQEATTPQSDTQSQSSTMQQQGSQATQTAAGKANLTADQKAELKQLKDKAHTACKADANSDACKQAKQDLHSKMAEYGVQPQHDKGGKMDQQSNQPPQ